MLFKTLILKIYKPTAVKKAILDQSMNNYTQALEWLLYTYSKQIVQLADSDKIISKGIILSLIDKKASEELNNFDVQPFKDSIKMEFLSIVISYIAQKRRRTTSFPSLTLNEDSFDSEFVNLLDKYTFNEMSSIDFKKKSASIINRLNKTHLLYFGRYSLNRDYCLLYDDLTERFYVKLYLLNNKNKITAPSDSGFRELKYVSNGLPTMKESRTNRRYSVLPLAFGKYQNQRLREALANPSILHTAKVIRKNEDYFLYLNIECNQIQKLPIKTTMGLARTEKGLHYSIPSIENGTIKANTNNFTNDSCIFNIASKIVKKAVKNRSQVILEANGGKNDEIMYSNQTNHITTTDYTNLAKVLKYKLHEAGLPQPIMVSANKLYSTCPMCGSKSIKNRLSSHIFACTECGYADMIDNIGSLGLALRLEKYKTDKLPIYCKVEKGCKIYYNKAINFQFKDNLNSKDHSNLFYQLSLYCRENLNLNNSSSKYFMIKKLRDSENIRDVVRIVNC